MSCSNCYLRTPPALCPALAPQPGNLFWDWIKQDVQSLGVPAKGLAGNPSGSSTPPKKCCDLAKCFLSRARKSAAKSEAKIIKSSGIWLFLLLFFIFFTLLKIKIIVSDCHDIAGLTAALGMFASCCGCECPSPSFITGEYIIFAGEFNDRASPPFSSLPSTLYKEAPLFFF